MKGLFEILALFSLKKILELGGNLIKGYLLKYYINIIGCARNIYLIAVLSIACLFLLFFGLLMVHVGLFYYLPWEMEIKVAIFMGLGGIYSCISLFLLRKFVSADQWLKSAGAQKVLDDLSGEDTP